MSCCAPADLFAIDLEHPPLPPATAEDSAETAGAELRCARAPLSPDKRTTLFNAAYEGYLLPFRVDEQQLAFMDDAFDLDLDASRIAFRDGEPVGLANLGLRGEDGWIGGVGVVPSARRSGVGEALMHGLHEQARERGVRRVWLEVIVENTGALALYEKLGYQPVQDVEVWSLPVAEGETPAARLPPRRRRRSSRSGASRGSAPTGRSRTTTTCAGSSPTRARCRLPALRARSCCSSPARRSRCSGRSARPRHGYVLNLPADDPAAAVLRELGGSVVVRQHEMLARAPGRPNSSDVRIALVTPFAWSQPHDVNEHVDGLARELRRRGHDHRPRAVEPRPRPRRRETRPPQASRQAALS